MIKFESLDEIIVPKMNGGTGTVKSKIFMNNTCKIIKCILDKDSSIGSHMQKTSSEFIYILSGEARCILDGKEEFVKAGELHYCPKGSTHAIFNNGTKDLVMIDIVAEQ